jgi:hypothetical protein
MVSIDDTGWPDGPLRSPSDFSTAVRRVIALAAGGGVRRMWWVSPDFEGWRLDDPALLDDLTRWVRAAPVQMTWLVDRAQWTQRLPRLVDWRRTWSHALDCRVPLPQDEPRAELPTLLLAEPGPVVQMFDRSMTRGRASASGRDASSAKSMIDVLLQQSTPGFPVTTLGL